MLLSTSHRLPHLGLSGLERTPRGQCMRIATHAINNDRSKHDAATAASTSYAPSTAELGRVASAIGAIVICSTLAGSCRPAYAAEREWKPRRHYRKLGERFSDKWAQELVEDQEKEVDSKTTARRRQEQLQREQEEAETARRRADEAVRRKKAEAILAQQAKDSGSGSALPFSVKLGGQELAPFIVWGGLGMLALLTLKGVASGASALRRGRGEGKWVYDRSLGGKKVWVPAEVATEGRPAIPESEINKLTSIAAAAAAGSAEPAKSPSPAVVELPTWWNPGPRFPPEPSMRASRQLDADRILSRMEASRNRGEDFALRDIVRLREICQEGCVVARPRTVGARDALYRTAVDAAVAVATDPSESFTYIGDAPPTRFLSALSMDIDLPPEKAVTAVTTAVAAATRSRLLEALAGIKEDHSVLEGPDAPSAGDRLKAGETAAVMSLIRLTSLLEKLPVLNTSSKEVTLIAESLQSTFTVDERRRAFYLMGQLFPEAAALAAALLGFKPEQVVPQLLADMEEYRRLYEENARLSAAAEEGQTNQ